VPALVAANKNPEVDVSVGYAHVGQAAGGAHINISSINWHSYNGVDNGKAFKGEVKWLEGIMEKDGKPIILTEWFGRPDMPIAGAYPIIREHAVPAYLWALLIVDCNQHWARPVARGDPPFQGLLWPNGTAYDELEEIECLRHDCQTLEYVHYLHNRDDFKDSVHSFSDGDWVEDIKGSAVFNHGIGPRYGSMMTSNTTGATVTISLLNNTKRVAIYLPVDTNGAEYTVKLDGKQIHQGTTIGPDRIWENRVVLPVVAQDDSKLEVVVGEGAPGDWRFMLSGTTFFFDDGPTPTPTPPAPPPAPTPSGPSSCGADQNNIDNFGINLKSLENPELDTNVCCKACDDLADCAGWTLNLGQKKCWLKKVISPGSKGGVISGLKPPHGISAVVV
jgi:hypothetical protein